jgi:hypothetical protein
MLSLQDQRRSHTRFASLDVAPFILAAGRLQELIQFFQAARLRHRRPMIPPKVSDLPFHPSFLIPTPGVTELGGKSLG